jgi:YkoY family integral membrane protein
LARGLPEKMQKKALTYGLAGAVIFRLAALTLVSSLLAWNWVKFVGGGYLLFLSVKHFFLTKKEEKEEEELKKHATAAQFWKVVILIELTDIAFAVDSILAAVALSNKFWVVFAGGIMGVLMMRVAASLFIKLLNKYPNFENTAYLLVMVIGVKVIVEGLRIDGLDFHHSSSPTFWAFWAIMAACVAYGFVPAKIRKQ